MAESTSKSAIITGGSSGIGLAIAHKMSDQGYRVLVADKAPLVDTKNKILFSTCDVTDPVQAASLFTKVQQEIGDPDVLVCLQGNRGSGINKIVRRPNRQNF